MRGVCRADIVVSIYLLDDRIILGRSEEQGIKVVVINLGNPAYGTKVLVSSSLNAAYLDAYQSPEDGTELVVCANTVNGENDTTCNCMLERLLYLRQSAVFRVIFNVSRPLLLPFGHPLDALDKYVEINIKADVDQPSIEIDMSNNVRQERVKVELVSDVELTG